MKTHYSTESGSARLVMFLVGITAALLWMGIQKLYTAARNFNPTAMSYETYVKSKPKAEWLWLTNCSLDLNGCAYKHAAGGTAPTELFIPVRSRDVAQREEPVHVLLATRDPALMATFKELQQLKSGAEFLAWEIKNADRVFPKRDVKGLVRFGIEEKGKERNRLAQLHSNLGDDFIILQDGAKPSFFEGMGFTAGGVLLLVGGLAYYRRNRDVATDEV